MEKGFSMKVFHSIFALILCFICIIYLLLCPQEEHFIFHNFQAEALAAENEHNTLSNALALSMETTYEEHIAANDKRYYYIPFQKKPTFQITSDSIRNIKINFLSETGKTISYNTKISKKSKTLALSADSFKSEKRIFLCLANQSVSPCSLQIYVSCCNYQDTEPKTKPAKKKSHTTTAPQKILPKTITIPRPPKNNNATSSPIQSRITQPPQNSSQNNKAIHRFYAQNNKNKKKLSTNRDKKIKLYPQFIKMIPESVEKFAISPDKNVSDFIWLSSNPLVATVTNGTVHAIKEGITIIYLHQKNHPEISSSCFIRVIERT